MLRLTRQNKHTVIQMDLALPACLAKTYKINLIDKTDSSVADPWNFGTDPDADLDTRINTSD